jgi:ferric-dicitrate binding protein FerR (iron transport regulator)
MKNSYDHIDPNINPGNPPDGFFERMGIPYAVSKEDAWAALEEKLTGTPSPRISIFKSHKTLLASAATILLLAGIFSVLFFYTNSVYCPAGQHLSQSLPDGSVIKLNADSKISYKPLWWSFARQVNFEGEGFFEVQKGKKFVVISELGSTAVLGTSFNIFSRGEEYSVTCFTGKVRVTSKTSAETVLTPQYQAIVNVDGNITVLKEQEAGVNASWVNNMFHFTARPLPLVFDEISRQYNITVSSKVNLDYSYSGYFSKERPVEDVLALVCKPFGLTFTKISGTEYEIH